MVKCPAKINVGLNIVRRRSDGYHDLETVFLPVPLYDDLVIEEQTEEYPYPCQLTVIGDAIECEEQKNLVVKAYNMLAEDHPHLPHIHATLTKRIPSQAGMGGGSSDAAYMLLLLNSKFQLMLSQKELEAYAARLGADCAFFIKSQPAYAEGIGERLYPIPGIAKQIEDYQLAIVKPSIAISTREAFANVTPHLPERNCLDVVMQPMEAWRHWLKNDFEESLFPNYPELSEIKDTLYRLGAVYASMSGSGSAMYGFFPKGTLTRLSLRKLFPECFTALISNLKKENG